MSRTCFSLSSAIFLLFALTAHAAETRWIRLTTPHFEMYTDCDEKKAIETILHFERVRDFFTQASPVRAPGEFPVRIVAFKDIQLMRTYAPNQNVAAYYAPGPVRDSIVMKEPTADSVPITIHEYVHLILQHSGLHLPLWLNEGWADVYSTLKPVKDGVAVGDLIPRHMATLAKGNWFPLADLNTIDTRSPDYNESSRTGTFYAESWALAHMLYLAPDYKEGFGKFITALNRGRTLEEATQTAWSKTPPQILVALQNYFNRKDLVGTVFLTPFQKSGDTPVVTPVTSYDSDLMLADLHAAALHLAPARRAFQQLETSEPTRWEAFASAGYLAVQTGEKETARKEFSKAFALGTTDHQLCMQLAALDREAKQPPEIIMAELDRAVKLKPDFTEAIFQLALTKIDVRDYDAALLLLGRVGMVAPDRIGAYRSAFAYVRLQTGNLGMARNDAEAARRAAKTAPEIQATDRLLALIDARSKGPAAVLPGEKVVKAEGTALGLRCSAPGTGGASKLGVTVDGKQMLFDLPDVAAVELTRRPNSKSELKCGAMPPIPLVFEYAPASVTNLQSAGIIRRLEF